MALFSSLMDDCRNCLNPLLQALSDRDIEKLTVLIEKLQLLFWNLRAIRFLKFRTAIMLRAESSEFVR